MRAAKWLILFLKGIGVRHIFGIPAGSVNAVFDELYNHEEIEPFITKHEGAAGYMASAYAKYSGSLAVCIGSSGPGATNLVSGAANAMREQQPVLFLTGAVPVASQGLNASQELNAAPCFREVTKYSEVIRTKEEFMEKISKAVSIALDGVPGPVHIAMPIDLQMAEIERPVVSGVSRAIPAKAGESIVEQILQTMSGSKGVIFAGQGALNSAAEVRKLAERFEWPIITSPQAKGLICDNHPLYKGIFGFAGHTSSTQLLEDPTYSAVIILGSSLGETATNNWNPILTQNKYVIHVDRDKDVFNRKYAADMNVHSEIQALLHSLLERCGNNSYKKFPVKQSSKRMGSLEYNTQNVLSALQDILPSSSRYFIDIGEFMSYVIHYMRVKESGTFDVNVHFGAMGSAVGGAIGAAVTDPQKPTVCITGDGCFFMHGMEILTAKEYGLPVLFIIMNNARLGMVHHGHKLQYKRVHERFSQLPVNITALAEAMNIPAMRISNMKDIDKLPSIIFPDTGPALLEIELVDENVPPMGDRVKFLQSFSK
ncbi:thiamine pyrophosphate-binding protein [Alteribacillus sp. HJP-4]|uniref:thiamine pyrophosphate-binding protein n=1 Tax=Alteribacillus sp. HJP-4 TaxID=2775394 RepID=UPI0035CD2438